MTQQHDSASLTITTAEAVEKYRLVRYDGSGNAVYCDKGEVPLGRNAAYAASGRPAAVSLIDNKPGTMMLIASGAVSAYATVYTDDDGKVTATQTGFRVGQALEAATTDGDIIEILPMPREGGLLYANLTDSAEVESTTAETAFDQNYTLDGAQLVAGDILHIIGRCYVLDNNSTDTLTLKLYVGTQEIVTTGAVNVADADVGYFEAYVNVRVAGASGFLSASGVVALGVPGTVTAKPWRLDRVGEDLSGDLLIAIKATWSVAHADNEVYLEDLFIEKLSA